MVGTRVSVPVLRVDDILQYELSLKKGEETAYEEAAI